MTVEKNIIYVPVISGQKDKRQNRKLAEELIGLVGLEREMLDRYPEELSGGQQPKSRGSQGALCVPPENFF